MILQHNLSIFIAALALILSFSQLSSSNEIEIKTKSAALTLKGKVADAVTTQNIAEVQISIPAQGISTLSDEEGKFELKNLPPGTLTLEVEAEGYKLWEKEMTLEEDTEFTIKLERSGSSAQVR
jgi:hypothetical protein